MRAADALRDALKRPEGWWTLVSNAIPVFGVLFFGWAALPLMMFYWIENVLIGAFNLPKILISGLTKPMPMAVVALFLAPFFALHYGLFCFVHGTFVLAIFAMSDAVAGRSEPSTDTFDVVGRVMQMLSEDADLKWSVVALLAVLAFRFVVFWLGRAQWRETDPMRQMFEPYGRIVVLHLTIFVVAIPIVAIGQPVIGVFVLAFLKTALELGLSQFQIGSQVEAETN